MFYFQLSGLPERTKEDLIVCKNMWSLIYQFITTGKPKFCDENGVMQDVPEATPDHDIYLDVTINPKVMEGFNCKLLDFWREKIAANILSVA